MKSAYCPICHRQSEVTESDGAYPCAHCGSSLLLRNRWWLPEKLGHGASGYTWKGVDRIDGSVVAIKELSFRRLTDLKQLELFEREAGALASLDHESIPDFIEQFIIEEDRFVSAYLVQEFIDGDVLDPSSHTDEEEVLRFLEEMADLLEHLQSRRPPVIHRDIKPSNVMRRRDGRYVLIDFGSIRAPAEATMGGSTVAGTLGYMAPEQLVGRAEVGSDYYGLGATAVALLAGRDAHHLIEHHRPGAWRERVKVSEEMAELLMRLVEVDVERRLKTPEELREAIEEIRSPGPDVAASTGPSLSLPSLPSLPGLRQESAIRSRLKALRQRLRGPALLTVKDQDLTAPLIVTAALVGSVFFFYHRFSPGLFQEMWFRLAYHGSSYVVETLIAVGGAVALMTLVFGGAIVALGMFMVTALKAGRWLIPILALFYLVMTVEMARTEIVPPTTEITVMQKGSETRFLSTHHCGFTVSDEGGQVVGLVEHRSDECTVEIVDERFLRIEAEDQLLYAHAWSAEVISNLAEDLADMGTYRVVFSAGPNATVEMQDGSTLNIGVVLPEEPTDLVLSSALFYEASSLEDLQGPELFEMQKESETRLLAMYDCMFTVTDEDGREVGSVGHDADECSTEVVNDRYVRIEAEDQLLYAYAWSAEVSSDLAADLAHMGSYRIIASTGNRALVEMEDGSHLNMEIVLSDEPTDMALVSAPSDEAPPVEELHRPEILLPSTCGRGQDGGPVVSHYSTAFGEGFRMVSGLDDRGRTTWTLSDPPSVFFDVIAAFDVDGECWFYVDRFFDGEMLRLDRDTGELSGVLRL